MADEDPRPTERPCPICGKPAEPRYRPFCSARCRLIDLGRWIDERYRIPAKEDESEAPGEDDC